MSELSNKAIYQLIERVSQSEGWIKEIRFSDFWIAEDKDNSYPLLIIDVLGGNFSDYPPRRSFEIQLTLFDQRRDDNLNFQDAVSSTRNVLEDIVVRLRTSPYSSDYGVRFSSDPSSDVIKWGDSNDKLIGTQMSFEISVPSSVCVGNLPPVVGSPSIILPECDAVISNVFSQNGTLLNSGSTSFPSLFNYTVGNLTIANEFPTQLFSVDASNSLFTIPNMVWENSSGELLASFLPVIYVEDQIAPDIVVVNSNGGESISLPLSGIVYHGFSASSLNVKVYNSEIDVLVNTGITSNYEFTVDDCEINLVPNGGAFIVSSTEVPAGTSESIIIPDFDVVNSNGQSATSVVYSGTVHVDFSGATAEGITYHRPQFQGQITSYAIGDVAWHFSSGTYDYPRTGGTIQELDHSASSPFYTLKYDNAFGNKFRYTTDQGEPASDQKADFRLESYSASTLYYVIDNLTGIGWLTDAISYNQNWSDAILSANTFSWSGFSETYDDWRMPCVAEIESVINMRGSFHLAENIFERFGRIPNAGSVVINMYLSDTSYSNSGNAYLYNDSAETGKRSKTSPSFHGLFPVRNHY